MITRLPRLLNSDLSERARLSPGVLSASVELSPPSVASMTLREGDADIKIHDFVEVYRGSESLGIFRASDITTQNKTVSVAMEHAIATLDDDIYPGAGSFTQPIAQAVQTIFAKQTRVMWALGTVETTDAVTVEYNGTKLLEMLAMIMASLPDYMLTFDQSAFPWLVSIVKTPDAVASECRLSRNIASLSWKLDDSDFCTRVYQTGSDVYYESGNVAEWGVKAAQQDLGINPDAAAADYLAQHDHPKLSMEISAVDLSAVTHDDMDRFTLGYRCRVALPAYQTVFTERIVSLQYEDLLNRPEEVTLCLSGLAADMASALIKNEAYVKKSIGSFEERIYHFDATAEKIETEMTYISQRQDENDETITILESSVSNVQQTADSLSGEVQSVVESQGVIEESIGRLELSDEEFALELSKKVTQEQVDESIDDIDEFHNTAVDITAQGVAVNTTGTISFTVDDELRMHIDEEAVNAPLVVADELRAKNAVLKNQQFSIPWKGSIQASLDAAPKWLADCNATLSIPAGTYDEDVTVRGFKGGYLNIMPYGNGPVTINGYVQVSHCDHFSMTGQMQAFNICGKYDAQKGATYSVLDIYNVGYAQITYMNISGYRGRTGEENSTVNGVDISASRFMVRNCIIEYTSGSAIRASYGSTGYVQNCTGGSAGSSYLSNINGSKSVYALYGSHIAAIGTIPMALEYGAAYYAATVIEKDTVQTAGGMDYVAPTEITKSFALTKHCTYVYGVSRIRDDQQSRFSQGRYGTYSSGVNNWRIGAMWFGEAASALSGRTIQKATLTLRRATGGWSMAAPVYLGSMALSESAFDTTLTPAFTASATQYPGASLTRETEGEYDVTELMTAVKQGYALAVYEPPAYYIPSENWSPAYTQFYGLGSGFEPVLTVTYS